MNTPIFSLLLLITIALVTVIGTSSVFAQSLIQSYNATEAIRAWYLCKLNSCDPTEIMNGFSCPTCKTIEKQFGEVLTDATVFYHEKALAHGYVAFSPVRNQIIVGFRGTRSERGQTQWIYDFDFKFVDFPGCPISNCKCHQGFLEIYQIMQANVSLHVSSLLNKYPSATVAVVGHSLGAATATLAAVDLINRMKAPVDTLINFGCPRVFAYEASLWAGNLLYSSMQAGTLKRSYRMVWANDPVPKIPVLEMGFWHLPSEVWYPSNTSTSQVSNPANYVRCNDGVGKEDLVNCSFQVPVQETDPSMHGWYMGIEHGCS